MGNKPSRPSASEDFDDWTGTRQLGNGTMGLGVGCRVKSERLEQPRRRGRHDPGTTGRHKIRPDESIGTLKQPPDECKSLHASRDSAPSCAPQDYRMKRGTVEPPDEGAHGSSLNPEDILNLAKGRP